MIDNIDRVEIYKATVLSSILQDVVSILLNNPEIRKTIPFASTIENEVFKRFNSLPNDVKVKLYDDIAKQIINSESVLKVMKW